MRKTKKFSAVVVVIAIATLAIGLGIVFRNWADPSLTLRGRGDKIGALAFAPDGLTLAVVSKEGAEVTVWDVLRRSEKYTLKSPGVVSNLRYSSYGELAAWDCTWDKAVRDESVKLWDQEGRPMLSLRPSTKPLTRLLYFPESHTIASAQYNDLEEKSTIRLENTNRGSERLTMKVPGWVSTLSSTPDGRFLAVQTSSRYDPDVGYCSDVVYVVDTETGAVRSGMRIKGAPTRIVLSPNGRLLAAGTMNGSMYIAIWDVESGEFKEELRVNVAAELSDIRFSPDGTTLAAGAGQRTESMLPIPTLD